MKENNPKLSKNQTGFVSILVTVIIILIISLLVIAFGKLVQRDQRQVLDEQLNTQAFYAAESGVNSVLTAIKNKAYTGEKKNCDDPSDPIYKNPYNVDPIIDASAGVEVSCLLIYQVLTSLEYDNVDTARSTVVPIKLKDTTTTISSITLSWQDTNGSTSFDCPWGAGTAPDLPPVSGWSCSTGVMRMDMVPFTGNPKREDLSNAMFTRFLYPSTTGGNTTAYVPLSQPDAYKVRCDATSVRYCSVEFTGLSSELVYLRLKSIYRSSAVTLTCTQANGLPCEIFGTQVLIDSTGKAGDVIKRIQVRAPVDNHNYLMSEGPLTTSYDICKRYVIKDETALSDTGTPSCGY